MENVCATAQKVLIEWLKRKCDAKIPTDPVQLVN